MSADTVALSEVLDVTGRRVSDERLGQQSARNASRKTAFRLESTLPIDDGQTC
jgi:hypothetical protein